MGNPSHDEELHNAVMAGSTQDVARLLAEGCDPSAFDDIGNTPLHYAVQDEVYEVMDLLLAAGADINARDESRIGETPLGEVAQTCSLKLAKYLLDRGADPTIRGFMRVTALDRAAKRKRGEGPSVYELLEAVADHRR